MRFKEVTATKYKLEITERTKEESGGVPIQCMFDENAQCIFMQVKNSYKKMLRLRHHFFLGAAFFATGFLTSGFFAAAFFAAAMWFPPPIRMGYIFFKFMN